MEFSRTPYLIIIAYPNPKMRWLFVKGISCPQFSDWSTFYSHIFLLVENPWSTFICRHPESWRHFFWKNKNLEKWPLMMTSVYFFLEVDREVLFGACFISTIFVIKEGTNSGRMHEISGVWRIGERNIGEIVDRLCDNYF